MKFFYNAYILILLWHNYELLFYILLNPLCQYIYNSYTVIHMYLVIIMASFDGLYAFLYISYYLLKPFSGHRPICFRQFREHS